LPVVDEQVETGLTGEVGPEAVFGQFVLEAGVVLHLLSYSILTNSSTSSMT
jgi:hypothetical protein